MSSKRSLPFTITILLTFEACLLGILRESSYRHVALLATGIGLVGFAVTYKLIPEFSFLLLRNGLCGIDLNKEPPGVVASMRSADAELRKRTAEPLRKIPEALGIVPSFVYIIGAVVMYIGISQVDGIRIHYASGLITILIMMFLGFVDDVVDLKWRYKLILPFIASLPMLVIYEGETTIIIPSAFKSVWPLSILWSMGRYLGSNGASIVNVGYFYHFYMSGLTTFTSNAINIFAGINGLEVGQSIIIAAFVLIHNAIEMSSVSGDKLNLELLRQKSHINPNHHCLSFILSILFLNVCAALWHYNKYPAMVFVGDTFTYMAGVHFGVVCVMGHFAKTLLLLLIPQFINFLLSLPQLLKIIPCPRHRVPDYDEKTGLMKASPNLTLLNATLRIFGDLSEKDLVYRLLAFQFLCCTIGLVVRYEATSFLY